MELTESLHDDVARAIYEAGRGPNSPSRNHPHPRGREIADAVWESHGTTKEQRDDIELALLQASAAIEVCLAWQEKRE